MTIKLNAPMTCFSYCNSKCSHVHYIHILKPGNPASDAIIQANSLMLWQSIVRITSI